MRFTGSLLLLIALAAGFMLSVALADLVPEAITRDGERGALFILAGFLLVHLTQHALVGHFHFGEETHAVSRRVSVSALAGLLLHTFGDGVAIASGFIVSPQLGVLVFGAIFAMTGRLWMLMCAHAAFDLTALAIIYWNLESDVAHWVFK